MGAGIAAEVLARGTSGARTAVLISPLLQLRPMIDEVSPQFGGYEWTDAGNAAAERLDYEAARTSSSTPGPRSASSWARTTIRRSSPPL